LAILWDGAMHVKNLAAKRIPQKSHQNERRNQQSWRGGISLRTLKKRKKDKYPPGFPYIKRVMKHSTLKGDQKEENRGVACTRFKFWNWGSKDQATCWISKNS